MIDITKKNLVYFLILLFNLTSLFAQQTNNLQIIWQKTSSESVFTFGRSISAGDVNGDGYSDIIIIGDSVIDLYAIDSSYRGKCWIFFGGQNFDTVPDVQLLNTQRSIFESLHSADINGDGFDDVIIGGTHNAGGYGQALIYLGGNPMDSILDYKVTGPHGGSQFGLAVSSGDVNDDGYKDLIVGAYGAHVPPVGYLAGKVYIYFGGPSFDTIPDVILNGGHCNDQEGFGSDIGQSADVNGDGYDDIIIGARTFGANNGRLYIYYGGNPIDSIADVAMIGEGPNHLLGWNAISSLRNANNVDYAMIGTSFWPDGFGGNINYGKIYILHGGNTMDSIPDVCVFGRTSTSRLASSLSRAGDLNGDYCDDLIAGAPIEYNERGTAYIWLGGPLLDTIPDAWISGIQYNDEIGWNVASAGDINGDGRDEIMVTKWVELGLYGKVLVCKYTGQGIEEERLTPYAKRAMLEVYPNPVKMNMTIHYSLTANSKVSLKIYDVTGKAVKVLSARCSAGKHDLRWDLKDNNQKKIANGIYFVRLVAEQRNEKISEITKITIMK